MSERNIDVIQPVDLLARVRENVLHVPVKKDRIGGSEQIIILAEQNLRLMENDLSSMRHNIDVMNTIWFHNLTPIHSNRKIVGPLIVLIKRAIQKAILWFCLPRIVQQNEFNGAATRALEDSIKIQKAILDELKRTR